MLVTKSPLLVSRRMIRSKGVYVPKAHTEEVLMIPVSQRSLHAPVVGEDTTGALFQWGLLKVHSSLRLSAE